VGIICRPSDQRIVKKKEPARHLGRSMVICFRALVMLVVLVGLPSAWVYYGPLPAGAQRVASRIVELGQEALTGSHRTEEKYGELPVQSFAISAEPVRFDPETQRATFQAEHKTAQREPIVEHELEPHLSVLRKMGASEYTLEDWGQGGQLVRFRCSVSMGGGNDFTRQFEAVAGDSLAAVRQVVGEVSAWQNARGGNTLWR
jgi:hypothetical protein